MLIVVLAAGTAIVCIAWQTFVFIGGSTEPNILHSANPSVAAPVSAEESPILFRAADLPFLYERGESGLKWPVEPVGGGVAIADFDGDGRSDLFFAQAMALPPGTDTNPPADSLLRNAGGQQFADVTHLAALAPKGYGMGVTAADYDADGFIDAYVTRYGTNTLWQNLGDGTLRDVTRDAGVGCDLWSMGAAFADIDGDGDLDLFVANYFYFDPDQAPFARNQRTGEPEYGAPMNFFGQQDVLYLNAADGTFADWTAAAGIQDDARGMGVLATDLDDDSKIDILVANDAQGNIAWRNLGQGKFEDAAIDWGIAFNARGETEANMGIAYADTNADAIPDILITHLIQEHDTLWRGRRSQQRVYFQDTTFDAGLAVDSRQYTGWGTVFADFDQDGMADLVVANGHIRPEPGQAMAYENAPLLWHNRQGRFWNVSALAGPYFKAAHMARGLATGDLDGDRDLDLVVVHHFKNSVVLWNETAHQGSSLLVELHGAGFNRSATGARVFATAGKRTWVRTLDGGGGYLSSNDQRLHFGLGPARTIDRFAVHWLTGHTDSFEGLAVDQTLRLIE
jgi:hypothetical protein